MYFLLIGGAEITRGIASSGASHRELTPMTADVQRITNRRFTVNQDSSRHTREKYLTLRAAFNYSGVTVDNRRNWRLYIVPDAYHIRLAVNQKQSVIIHSDYYSNLESI